MENNNPQMNIIKEIEIYDKNENIKFFFYK